MPAPLLTTWSRLRFALLCLALGAASLAAGDWAAREVLLWSHLKPIEALRDNGGRYIVHDLLEPAYEPAATNAVYFADSTNDSIGEHDQDRRFVSEMLSDALDPDGIEAHGVSFPGTSIDWIASHLRFLIQRYRGLDYAVVPLNIRWISPAWRDRSQTTGERQAYEIYGAGPLPWAHDIELAYHSPRREWDREHEPAETVLGPFDASRAHHGADEYIALFGGEKDAVIAEIERARIIVSYGFELSPEDPFFALMERIAGLCEESGLRCLFYLPPYNLRFVERVAEAEVAQALNGNFARIRDFASARGLTLLDLSAHLAPENFTDKVNEHVDETGRRLIAGCIAATLRGWQGGRDFSGRQLECRDDPSGPEGFGVHGD